ncbi:RHS repeat domain-containing protein [Hydrogeniiclostridium mannosilyticum]|uniref:RHS repeat domain-containing protein n=1 Tax=Hydrogeniiclostridium mannosilyticum TaxID=2764322 RepID=UPI0015AC6672|nr:RHS repeat-associated core domain-containing protein [Hydrogeniiclostridium mannosilyticum]
MRYTLVRDLQGNVIGLADKNGNLAAKYTYDAWGNILSVTDGQGNDVSGNPGHIANVNPLRCRGYYFDQETGFYYLHTRYYDPKVGRFINADEQLNMNLRLLGATMFVYCLNNPTNMIDTVGQFPRFIYEQNNDTEVSGTKKTMGNISWGRGNIAANGCGIIAVFNLVVTNTSYNFMQVRI